MAALLDVRGLATSFATEDVAFNAVDGVSFSVEAGKTLGLVGESGCGKSVTALSIMGLISAPGRIAAGEILFEGADLLRLAPRAMRDIRGNRIAMIFQEPMTSLNPAFTIGDQIVEGILRHRGISREAAKRQAIEMLEHVRMPLPAKRFDDHPHRLSGGMRQRAMIAMALACRPKLLIADEPTTALDVTIQAQILDLLQDMKERFGMAVMLITHAMGVVAETAQRVVVMYAGKVVEEAPVDELFGNPRHPYTQGLIRSIPRIDLDAGRKTRLETIGGSVPILINPAPGCRFAPRCRFAMSVCTEKEPVLREIGPRHRMACHLGAVP
jgi:peptide/nickel transport system ATP-binding protein